LDDAVVNDGDAAGGVRVRVGVAVRGAAVGGPARVADAEAAGSRMAAECAGEFREPAGLLADVQFRAGAGDHAGAIVATIFEAFETVEKNRRRFAIPGEANDSAHPLVLPA